MSSLFVIFVEDHSKIDEFVRRVHAFTSSSLKIFAKRSIEYPHTIVSDERDIFTFDEKMVVYVKLTSSTSLDVATMVSLPLFSRSGDVSIIPINRFIGSMWKGDVVSTLSAAGYTFNDVQLGVPSTLSSDDKVINHLLTIFPFLSEVMASSSHLFIKAFQHESYSKVSNYEMLEAYGDRFLAAAFIQIISTKPGLWSPSTLNDLIMHWQSQYVLGEIAERYSFNQYIRSVAEIDLKIESDIIEALIAATYFSFEWVKGNGFKACVKLIELMYDHYDIDPKVDYKNPVTKLNEVVTANLDNTKTSWSTSEKDGFFYTYFNYYDGKTRRTLGIGAESMFGSDGKPRKSSLYEHNSKNKAALNAIENVKRFSRGMLSRRRKSGQRVDKRRN